MSREVRRVPEGWQHPKDEHGQYQPLLDGYKKALDDFAKAIESKGLAEAIEYYGGGPRVDDYMPDFAESDRTHLMMYETCSEGTPISPAFASAEELARWLVDNNASAFGSMTAGYDQWLRVCNGGFAPSMVTENGQLKPGVCL